MKLTTDDHSDLVSDLVSIDSDALASIFGGCGKHTKGGGGCAQTACATAAVAAPIAPPPDPGISVRASYAYNGATASASATA